MGESRKEALRLGFDGSIRLEFHGATISSDGGLLPYRDLDDAFALTVMAGAALRDWRTGTNSPRRRQNAPSGSLRGPRSRSGVRKPLTGRVRGIMLRRMTDGVRRQESNLEISVYTLMHRVAGDAQEEPPVMCRTLSLVFTVIGLGLVIAASAATDGARIGRPLASQPASQPNVADTNPAWNRAEIVFIGELTEAKAGPVAMSMPPIFLNRLSFKVEKVLRGTLADKTTSCAHSYRNDTNFPYETGRKYIVALTTAQQTTAVRNLRLADDAAIKEVELACALPPGWTIACGETLSPWAGMGKSAWSAELPADAEKPKLTCEKTGRPALLAGPTVAWAVEPVPPAKSIQWTNPDGDGEYKLTLTNATDQAVTVPALLTQDGKTLWRECVVILCQEQAYACPGGKGVAGKVSSLVLKPKESVSTVVNALALKGPQWPGGDRIEFTFCLGDKAKTMSFYYMARHHDALRDAAQKSVVAEKSLPADGNAKE